MEIRLEITRKKRDKEKTKVREFTRYEKYYDKGKIAFAIDDSPKHAEEYAKHGIKCYVPYKNYNKHLAGDNIYFYNHFDEVIRKQKRIL